MKILTKSRALKFVGLQVAVIVCVLIAQMFMVFFSQNRILVIEQKKGSWIDIAEAAEGSNSACQNDLAIAYEKLKALQDNK